MKTPVSQPEIDRALLAEAYRYALQTSHDARTPNAALLVDPRTHTVLARGSNGLPAGVADLPERRQSPAKYQYFEHAERSAIMQAARLGIKTAGMTLYVPWFACTDCAKAIIGAGISEVVGHAAPCRYEGPWSPSIEIGLTMFREAGVRYRYFEGDVGVAGVPFAGALCDR